MFASGTISHAEHQQPAVSGGNQDKTCCVCCFRATSITMSALRTCGAIRLLLLLFSLVSSDWFGTRMYIAYVHSSTGTCRRSVCLVWCLVPTGMYIYFFFACRYGMVWCTYYIQIFSSQLNSSIHCTRKIR